MTTLISLALPTCGLFVLLMQSVKKAQFLNITFLMTSFAAAAVDAMFGIAISFFKKYNKY